MSNTLTIPKTKPLGQTFTIDWAAALVGKWRNDPIDAWRKKQRAMQFVTWGDVISPMELSRQAEIDMAAALDVLGYIVHFTTHKTGFDLLVNDCLKIEVKASLYHCSGGRWRYQANLRDQTETADVVIFVAKNAQSWPFIIPAPDLAGQKSITIRTAHPNHYTGKYAQYLNAWDVIGEALESAKQCTYQTSFLGVIQ